MSAVEPTVFCTSLITSLRSKHLVTHHKRNLNHGFMYCSSIIFIASVGNVPKTMMAPYVIHGTHRTVRVFAMVAMVNRAQYNKYDGSNIGTTVLSASETLKPSVLVIQQEYRYY